MNTNQVGAIEPIAQGGSVNRHYVAQRGSGLARRRPHEEKSVSVISSGAEGAVENGATGEAATWTGRLKAERTGSERIKSLDVTGLAIHQHQDRSKLGSVD